MKERIVLILLFVLIFASVVAVYFYDRRFFIGNECLKSDKIVCEIAEGCGGIGNNGEKIRLYGRNYECVCNSSDCPENTLCDGVSGWYCKKIGSASIFLDHSFQSSDDISDLINISRENSKKFIVEVAGSYSYYLKTDNSIAPYKYTARHRVCFEPAQEEIENNGEFFCFNNTQEALNILGIKNIDNTCKKYWGPAKISIVNLTKIRLSYLKNEACVKIGNCTFNEADLVSVIDMYGKAPQCEK